MHWLSVDLAYILWFLFFCFSGIHNIICLSQEKVQVGRCISSRYGGRGGAPGLEPVSPFMTAVIRLPASHVMTTEKQRLERGDTPPMKASYPGGSPPEECCIELKAAECWWARVRRLELHCCSCMWCLSYQDGGFIKDLWRSNMVRRSLSPTRRLFLRDKHTFRQTYYTI